MRGIAIREDGTLVATDAPSFRAGGTPGGTSPLYGAGGLFGVCGMNPTLINACVGPMGVEGWLEWVGTDIQSPMYDALTSISSTAPYAQSGLCADCGKPLFKECGQSACLGRLCQMTNEHAVDQIGLKMNRGVAQMTLFGNITNPAGEVILGKGQPITDAFTLDLIGAAYNLRRRLGQEMWIGNPAANLGGHFEFPGFQLLVNTGKVDINTGIACPGLDSWLINYGNNVVGAVGSPSIVAYAAAAYRSLNYRMFTAGLNPATAEKALIMHPRTWDQVADAWACEYGLVCRNTTSSAPPRNDAMALANFRNDMRQRQAVPIDGEWVPVVQDNQIPQVLQYSGNRTCFRSDIYYMVKRVEGMTTLWGEFQDFNKTFGSVSAWFSRMFGASIVAITDGGRFAIAPTTFGGFCFDARVLTKNRIIATMPQLLARIQNVTVCPLATFPDVTASGGIYEKGGGTPTKVYLGLYGECGVLGIPT